jgi:hypothetical protein
MVQKGSKNSAFFGFFWSFVETLFPTAKRGISHRTVAGQTAQIFRSFSTVSPNLVIGEPWLRGRYFLEGNSSSKATRYWLRRIANGRGGFWNKA